MCHINHRVTEALVYFFELGAQLPLKVWIDNRQRFVEKNRADIGSHEPAAQRNFLFVVGI